VEDRQTDGQTDERRDGHSDSKYRGSLRCAAKKGNLSSEEND